MIVDRDTSINLLEQIVISLEFIEEVRAHDQFSERISQARYASEMEKKRLEDTKYLARDNFRIADVIFHKVKEIIKVKEYILQNTKLFSKGSFPDDLNTFVDYYNDNLQVFFHIPEQNLQNTDFEKARSQERDFNEMLKKADRLEGQIKNLETKLGSANLELQSVERATESAGRKWQGEIKMIEEATREELARLTKALQTKIGTDEAQENWNKKADQHETQSRSFFWILLGLLLVSPFAFSLAVYALVSWFSISLTEFTPGLILVLFLPLVALLWVLRLVGSLYRSNRDRADDAHERVAMLRTFISMQEHGQAKDEERAIVLQALFRPFARGPEETLPNPAWEAIIKRIESAKPPPGSGST